MNKILFAVAFFLMILTSCGGKEEKKSKYPENFNSIGDAGRVDYMIRNAPADSVARFIIYSALGQDKESKIDTLAIASVYAYEKLTGEDLEKFSLAYDALVESLPLADKMKIYVLGGSEDPQGLGYKLGLEYMASIREDNKKIVQVEEELREFEKACGSDTVTFRRFMIGFQTVLRADHGKDVPEDIYRKYTD